MDWGETHMRRSNLDLVAAQLTVDAKSSDLIVLSSFELGVTFDRYYRGGTPWETVPAVNDHKVHRYDLVKQRMLEKDPMRPLCERIDRVLRGGGSVWVVGHLPLLDPRTVLPRMAQPPLASSNWNWAPYSEHWRMQVGLAITSRATTARVTPPLAEGTASRYENVPVFQFTAGNRRSP
jgi:hypothetical protein